MNAEQREVAARCMRLLTTRLNLPATAVFCFVFFKKKIRANAATRQRVNAPYMSSPNGPRGPPKTPILCLTLTNNFKKKLLSIRVM